MNNELRKTTLISDLNSALHNFKHIVIGIASIAGTKGMIIQYDGEDSYMQVITLLPLGGSTNEHIAVDSPHVNYAHIFPDGKSLYDMLADPIEFNNWCKSNNIR